MATTRAPWLRDKKQPCWFCLETGRVTKTKDGEIFPPSQTYAAVCAPGLDVVDCPYCNGKGRA